MVLLQKAFSFSCFEVTMLVFNFIRIFSSLSRHLIRFKETAMAINGITSSTGHISIVIEDDSTDTTDVEALQDRMMNNLGGDSPFSDMLHLQSSPSSPET